MTYQESEKYKQDNIFVVGQKSELKNFPYTIRQFLIAPKNLSFSERIKILEKVNTGISNERALSEMGYLNDNLDVYIIAEDRNGRYEYNLYNYLSESGQND